MGSETKPKVIVPQGPPPKKLVVKDLRKGAGAMATVGRTLGVQYIGVSYQTGKEFEANWGGTTSFPVRLGSGEVLDGWEMGLKGMKVGGLRELIVPPKLAYNTGTLIYVFELLSVE